jgi:hypothetical protein
MPDQSSAATEHAIIQEISGPLQSLPEDPVATVHADFPAALRGYDRLAVDAYVQKTSQLVAELQATRSPESAVRRALERVGEQISGILQRAHQTAEEITAQSRRESEERLEQARIEAAEIIAAAHQRVKELDADTDRIWIERHRIVDDARELAHQLASLVDAAGERFPASDEETEPFLEQGSVPESATAHEGLAAPDGLAAQEGLGAQEGLPDQAAPTAPFDADATARFTFTEPAAGDDRQAGSAGEDDSAPRTERRTDQ